MGGAIHEGNQTPSAEFNIWIDPDAAARVFESGLDVTMVGLDVTNKAVLSNADAESLRGAGPVAEAAADMLDFYLGFYNEAYDHGGAPIHDAVALAHVFRPDFLTVEDRHVEVDTIGRPLPRAHGRRHASANVRPRSQRSRGRGHRRGRLQNLAP